MFRLRYLLPSSSYDHPNKDMTFTVKEGKVCRAKELDRGSTPNLFPKPLSHTELLAAIDGTLDKL